MHELRQREPRMLDEAFLKRVRQLPCIMPRCQGQAEAAHIGMSSAAHGVVESGSAKPHDCFTVPLCAYHHRLGRTAEHVVGTFGFWQSARMDPFDIAKRLYRLHAKTDSNMDAVEAMRLLVLEERFNADT